MSKSLQKISGVPDLKVKITEQNGYYFNFWPNIIIIHYQHQVISLYVEPMFASR